MDGNNNDDDSDERGISDITVCRKVATAAVTITNHRRVDTTLHYVPGVEVT